MDVDQVLTKVGESGFYQLQVYNWYSLLAISTAFHHLMQVFTAGVSQYRCKVPINDTQLNCTDLLRGCQDGMLIPVDISNTQINEQQCTRYSNYENITSATPLVYCDDGYLFDHSRYTRTIQEDFLLVCDNTFKPALAQSVYFGGVLAGSVVFGSIADWIGRKPTIIICVVLQSVFGTATAFASSFAMYSLLRFITATAAMGIFLVDFIIVSELAGVKWRINAATILGCYWSFGIMLMSLIAYFIRDWRTLQIALSVPSAFALLYLPFLPESPRWLLSQRAVTKAEKTLRRLAKKKKSALPLNNFLTSEKNDSNGKRKHTFVDLLRYPKLRMYTLNMMFNWFVIVMVYFAISINTSSLGIDPYIAFMLNGLLEQPSYILTLVLMNRYRRRPILCMFLTLSTAACLASGFIKPGVGLFTVVMLGKFGVSSAFSVVYLYSAEIFPTPVRAVGLGLASMSGRFGSIFSPLVLLLSEWWISLPVLFFSFLSFLCCLLCLLLPETFGQKLPQNINSRENSSRVTQTIETETTTNLATEHQLPSTD